MAETRKIDFSIHPDLLSRQLGSDMYRAPEALKQLVANALDAGGSRTDIAIYFNQLEAPERVVISDNGCGITPGDLGDAFREVGVHVVRHNAPREVIGTRGIGRFAVFSLGVEARWETIAQNGGVWTRQRWTMVPGRRTIEVDEEVAETGIQTGTTIDLTLRQREDVARLFGSVKLVKRVLFNAFAGYLARYQSEVSIFVNGEAVSLDEFVDERLTEQIQADGLIPAAQLHHMVLGQHVEQPAPNVLVFAAHGATVSQEVLGDEGIPGKKYLGLVDSPHLSELTNTSKSELPEFDAGFRALKETATDRAREFIRKRQGDKAREFLERARRAPYYPYQGTPKSPVETYRRQLYDGVLLSLDETYRIGAAPAQQQELIFKLAQQLLHSEDLAKILTSVLGLRGQEVARFAELLKHTTLTSVIAVAELLVDRFRFLDELDVLIYGGQRSVVKERKHLHKIVESHTWLFGEQYHLMSSDRRVETLLKEYVRSSEPGTTSDVDVDPALRDVPDLYLARAKWNDGARYNQHLIVELKRPSIRVSPDHVQQLTRYAMQIVDSPVFSQRSDGHQFTFVVVSAEISDAVTKSYQEHEEPGFLSRPKLQHPTELWALRWSDYLDRRREELKFLEREIEVTGDPELLDYLRSRVGEHLPDEIVTPRSADAPL